MEYLTLLNLHNDNIFNKSMYIDYLSFSKLNDYNKKKILMISEMNKFIDILKNIDKKYLIDNNNLIIIGKYITINKLLIKNMYDNIKLEWEFSEDEYLLFKKVMNENLDHYILDESKMIGIAPKNNVFSRKTTKYYVPNHMIQYIINHISNNLNMVKYNPQWTSISSIYYDNSNHNIYYNRLIKSDNSECWRIRRYNKNNTIYLEKKDHCNNDNSKKTRIESNNINNFANINVEDSFTPNKLLSNFINNITDQDIRPILKINYNRISWGNKDIRICLDININICKYNNKLKIDFNNQIYKSCYFDYSMLEIKILNTDENNISNINYIQELIDKEYIIEIPKYSKFLTASHMIYGDAIKNLNTNNTPYWINHLYSLNMKYTTWDINQSNNNNEVLPKGINSNILINIEKIYLKKLLISLKILVISNIKFNIIDNYYKDLINNIFTIRLINNNLNLLLLIHPLFLTFCYFIYSYIEYIYYKKTILNRYLLVSYVYDKLLIICYIIGLILFN